MPLITWLVGAALILWIATALVIRWHKHRPFAAQKRTEHFLKALWRPVKAADKVKLLSFIVAIVSVSCLAVQLRINTKTTRIAIRGQLYDREAHLMKDESDDPSHTLSSLWAIVPEQLSTKATSRARLEILTRDATALRAANAAELYHSMFDLAVFADKQRRDDTAALRGMFLYVQSTVYDLHNGYDYHLDGIVDDNEWRTWKGLLREMHGHPLLVTAIWQGHENRYLSRPFAKFLQHELCPKSPPKDISDLKAFLRDQEFVESFLPEMKDDTWPEVLANYPYKWPGLKAVLTKKWPR